MKNNIITSKNYFRFKEFSSLTEFEFPIACNDLFLSRNNKRLLAVGIYKPTVKLFDLKTLTLKFERNLICDPLKVLGLDDEADKFLILRNDKTLEFHLNSGAYEKLKTPSQPKSVILNPFSAEIYLGGNYKEIYRFNLEQGRFLKNIQSLGGENLGLSEVNSILGASKDNNIAFFDARKKEEIFTKSFEENITGFAFDESGIKYSLCMENGMIFEYDFRSENVFRSIEIEESTSKIMYSKKNLIVSSDENIFIIQDNNDIDIINIGHTINTFDSKGGIIFVGGENEKIKGYCSDLLGEYPSWFVDLIPK